MGGGGAQANDDARLDYSELRLEPRMACLNLSGRRFLMEPAFASLLEAEMLYSVGHINCASVNAGGVERLVEQPASGADEGAPLQVFLVSWRLANQNHLTRPTPFAEDSLRGLSVEIATSAAIGGASQRCKILSLRQKVSG